MVNKLKICILFALFTFLYAEEIIQPSHAIYFAGNHHFEKSVLEEAMGVQNKSFFQFWKKDDPRIQDTLRPTLEASLKSFYQSEGFYDANFTIKDTTSTYQVSISENEPVKVSDINISSDYDIASLITFKQNDIFQAKKFIEIKNKIIEALLKEGYCSYDLDTKAYVDLEKHTVDLVYKLQKGGICTFGKLQVEGLETINEEVIQSRLEAKEGKAFSTELIQNTSNNLYALKAFDSVIINVDRKFYNVVPVDIVVKEMQKPYYFEAGVGYDTYVGPRVQSQITKHNFMGNAQELALKAGWSEREQLLTLHYFKPALMNLFDFNIDLGGDIGYSNLEFDGFQEEKEFIKGYLEHTHGRLTLRAGLAVENIKITALDNLREGEELQQAVNEGIFLLSYSYVDFIYDARDSKLNPKYGYYIAASSEAGLSSEEESSVYHKTEVEGRLIYTFANLTLAAVGKIGVMEVASPNGLPESKYFFGGGVYSNRAYGYRELGVILSPTQDSIYGASTMTNLSFEADYPIWGDLYGAVFTDNTMLAEESYDFTGDIISSAGVGVRYMTPIGPFKLDVGFNTRDTSQYAISFQIGQSF